MTEAELAKLYARYGYVVFRRCMVYLGTPDAAQRAVQDIFLRVVRNADVFAQQHEPYRWLCRSVDELCLGQLRRERRASPSAVHDTPDRTAELEAAVANDDSAALVSVRKLVRELDPESFRLAVLYFMDELTEEELAHELGVSRRKLEKRERELLQRTRGLLQAESVA